MYIYIYSHAICLFRYIGCVRLRNHNRIVWHIGIAKNRDSEAAFNTSTISCEALCHAGGRTELAMGTHLVKYSLVPWRLRNPGKLWTGNHWFYSQWIYREFPQQKCVQNKFCHGRSRNYFSFVCLPIGISKLPHTFVQKPWIWKSCL